MKISIVYRKYIPTYFKSGQMLYPGLTQQIKSVKYFKEMVQLRMETHFSKLRTNKSFLDA